MSRGPSTASRQTIYARDGGRCTYCGMPISVEEATYDHRVPRAQGGTSSQENMVLSCTACNSAKADLTDQQWRSLPKGERERRIAVARRAAGKVILRTVLGA